MRKSIHRERGGASIRGITAEVGLSKATVRKALETAQEGRGSHFGGVSYNGHPTVAYGVPSASLTRYPPEYVWPVALAGRCFTSGSC